VNQTIKQSINQMAEGNFFRNEAYRGKQAHTFYALHAQKVAARFGSSIQMTVRVALEVVGGNNEGYAVGVGAAELSASK
jgi:hypothetical protein